MGSNKICLIYTGSVIALTYGQREFDMKAIKLKFILVIATLISSNYAYASITVVKKKRVSIEVEASKPIDDSYITSLDEDSMFEKVTGTYNDELDFMNELEPESKANKKAHNSKRNVSSSEADDFEAQFQN